MHTRFLPSPRQVYPVRQSESLAQLRRQPAVFASTTPLMHTLPAGHGAPSTSQARLQSPPGANSRLMQTPGPQSVATVQA